MVLAPPSELLLLDPDALLMKAIVGAVYIRGEVAAALDASHKTGTGRSGRVLLMAQNRSVAGCPMRFSQKESAAKRTIRCLSNDSV